MIFSLIVQVEVRPECRHEFLAAIAANAETSVRAEPGCLRFDVCSVDGDPNRFVFYELYADSEAFRAHRSAPHFAAWRQAAARTLASQTNAPGALLHTHQQGARVNTEARDVPMAREPAAPWIVIRPDEILPVDRGNGVVTIPFVGRWNTEDNKVTTGMTVFASGTGIALHSHNVEETVFVHQGEATAVIGGEEFDLVAGQATWVPAGIPHCFRNRGDGPMTIYWVYGGRHVTRTMTATGETFEHLSEADRGGVDLR